MPNQLLLNDTDYTAPANQLGPLARQVMTNPVGTETTSPYASQSVGVPQGPFNPIEAMTPNGPVMGTDMDRAHALVQQGITEYAPMLLGMVGGAPKPPALLPAWRIAGRVFSSPEATTHQAAWNLLSDADRTAAVNNAGSLQKVFVDETGKVLDRRKAFDYAMDNDMLHPAFVKAFRNAAGDVNPYAELTAEMLTK